MSHAEAVLRKLLDKIVAENKYNGSLTLKSLTSEGANYTSALFSATITPDHGETLKVFAKVANVNEKLRQVTSMRSLFETELYVYDNLVKVYERIQDIHNLQPEHRFLFPKFYGGNCTEGEETVVLEDLTVKGYSPYSRFKPVDWEHAAAAVESLARYHALSFAFAKEEPDNFNEAKEKLKYQRQGTDDNTKEAFIKMLKNAASVVREDHKEKLKEFLFSKSVLEEVHKFKKPLSTPVFCHGDYRISNLLFKQSDERLESIVVDYQIVVPACPVTDLLYLEFLGTDEEFRRENHEKLVDHYYKELTLALDRLDLDVDEVYPRETFDRELQEMLPAALLVSCYILPLVLVEEDRVPQFEDAVSVKEIFIPPNQLFAERFSGIVSDCVRWGAI